MQKSILSAAIVAGALAMSSGANASECGEISMADMNWPSATLMANVDKIILEAGYRNGWWRYYNNICFYGQ